MTDEWELFLRALTLERHKGMPRWNLTPAPEHTPRAFNDSPTVVAQRRAEIEALEREDRQHLRRVA